MFFFYINSEKETSRNGRWMFGRTITFVIDLTVASLMANVRTKEKVNKNKENNSIYLLLRFINLSIN
jgi:hypothetical protein